MGPTNRLSLTLSHLLRCCTDWWAVLGPRSQFPAACGKADRGRVQVCNPKEGIYLMKLAVTDRDLAVGQVHESCHLAGGCKTEQRNQ